MSPERTNATESIPAYREIVSVRMRGCAVVIEGLSIKYRAGANEDDAAVAIKELFAMDRETAVTNRFYIGDLYNDLPVKYGERTKWVKKHFPQNWDKWFKILRQFGWVAHKWPADRRSDKAGWTFYLRNKPGKPGKGPSEKDAKAIRLEYLDVVDRDGTKVMRGMRGERVYEMVVEQTQQDRFAEDRERVRG